MIDTSALAKLVPGFDFLQNLMQTAGQSVPMGQWVAPTLDPAEIDKRVSELKTVQFWLEQNARMIGTTIQALEVQRMTLNTLQTMNLPMDELRQAMTLPEPPARATTVTPEPKPEPPKRRAEAASAPASPARPAVDPMQWWGALTQQFGELASKALNDGSALAAQAFSGGAGAPAEAAQAAPRTKAARSASKTAPAPAEAGDAPPKKAARRRGSGA